MRSQMNLQGQQTAQMDLFERPQPSTRRKAANDDNLGGRTSARSFAMTKRFLGRQFEDAAIGEPSQLGACLTLADLEARCGPAEGYASHKRG